MQQNAASHMRTNTAEISNDMFGLYGGAVMGGGIPSPDKPATKSYGNGAATNNPFW